MNNHQVWMLMKTRLLSAPPRLAFAGLIIIMMKLLN